MSASFRLESRRIQCEMLSHRKVTNIESEVEKAQCLMKSTETTKTMFVVGCRQEIALDITSSPTSSGCSTKEDVF